MLLRRHFHKECIQSSEQLGTSSGVNAIRTMLFRRRIMTATGLGIISAAEFISEQNHTTQLLPQPFRAVAESLSHLVLGYTGPLVGQYICTSDLAERHPIVRAFGCILIADAAAELGQDALLGAAGSQRFSAPNNLIETTKDLSFAYIGGSLLYAQNRCFEQTRASLNEPFPENAVVPHELSEAFNQSGVAVVTPG